MNYADIIKGTWYPMGGMYEITKGFKKLSEELGVKYIKSEEINSFKIENNKIHLALSKKSTGAILTIDGGNIAASLR